MDAYKERNQAVAYADDRVTIVWTAENLQIVFENLEKFTKNKVLIINNIMVNQSW